MNAAVSAIACDRQRILVADDEEPIRRLFTTILSYGLPAVKVDTACNGLEAVKSFQLTHQAVILMDLKMPEMDGVQASMAIRDYCLRNNREMPAIVFCTGFSPPDSLNDMLGDGSRHYLLRKPVTSDQIINAVKSRLKVLG